MPHDITITIQAADLRVGDRLAKLDGGFHGPITAIRETSKMVTLHYADYRDPRGERVSKTRNVRIQSREDRS